MSDSKVQCNCCYSYNLSMWLFALECSDDSVRLVDGDNYNATSGRVEFCVGGRWGTVCNEAWGEDEADVVCQQLGLNTFRKAIP